MLTASGASCEYGGITCRSADGGPIADEFYEAAMQVMPSDPVIDWGEVTYADFVNPYIEYVRSLVDEELIASADLSVVVDPMYGAARGILSGARVIADGLKKAAKKPAEKKTEKTEQQAFLI